MPSVVCNVQNIMQNSCKKGLKNFPQVNMSGLARCYNAIKDPKLCNRIFQPLLLILIASLLCDAKISKELL